MSLAPKITAGRDAAAESSHGPLRVVVLDDDPVFRTVLRRMLKNIGLDVVSTCGDIEAAKRVLNLGNIDAVTIDVVLKNESGLDFLKWCHANHRSVLTTLVTAGTAKGARTGVDAAFLGAAALLTKPDAAHVDGFEDELRRVFNNGQQNVRPSMPATTRASIRAVPTLTGALKPAERNELLAIGASTGGPPVLLRILKGLPLAFDVPVVITQHMPALHIQYLSELLTTQSGRKVSVAADGEAIERGHVYLAGVSRCFKTSCVPRRSS